MKIAFFTDTYYPDINGVARTYQRLVSFLAGRGIQTEIFAPAGSECGEADPSITRFMSYNFFLYPECKIAFPNYYHIHRVLDRFKPDLIHIATPFALGLAGLKYAKAHDVPAVGVFHTNFPQYLAYYRVPWLKKMAWQYLRWFHSQLDRTFCPSTDTKKLLIRHSIPNLDIWRRGVDQNMFNPARRSLEFRRQQAIDDKKVLLYVGRLAPEKSVDVLLKALVVANSSSANMHLLVVGDGPKRKELEEIAPDNVTFLGYRSGGELAKIYASADIFVCPSVTETFGNVVLEAMAAALPVIAPLAGGIKENLFPDKTGLACLPHNAHSMANAICRMANDEGLRSALANQAYEHAKSQTWDAVLSGLMHSYQNVIESQRVSNLSSTA
ncbi:MAG: glycosyltransferase family 1 protein [Negativicutes bacterium]|nr:glycosyltransferase family 1 protein [Negativicutes bacterium]